MLISVADPERGMEKLVLVIETPSDDDTAREALLHTAQERAADYLETAVDDIVLVAPDTVPRTESGKVRRAALRELYLAGLGQGAAPRSPRRSPTARPPSPARGRSRLSASRSTRPASRAISKGRARTGM